jgi:chromosome segregation protein
VVAFNKLRLTGFKSFVDATELLIEPGLTGIVGPNGCGKSNLVEALRWVMGETSAKAMRGGEMDEVIFGGTRDRPARNIAEVSVFLDNKDRRVPAAFNEYDDLEVTRRIEREKGSLYRVNGRDVRAKDVQLLFADVATGARSTAIVSQGRIGAIINSKPAQRRNLLEEAAGITGLHSRRHEAELRLKAAEENLHRLNDVIVALEAQLETLKKQARQAARYRAIAESIRAAEALVFFIKRSEGLAALERGRAALAEIEAQVADRTGVAAAAATAQAEAAADMPALRKAEVEAAAKLQVLTVARDKLDEELARIAAARAAAEARLAQIKDDLIREGGRLQDADAALERIAEEKAQLEADQAAEAESRETARTTLMDAAKAVEAVEEELVFLNKRINEMESARAAARQQLNEAEMRRTRADRRLSEVLAQLETARASALPEGTLAEAENAASEAERAVNSARAAWEEAEAARAEAQHAYELARDAAQTRAAAFTKLQAEAVALEDLLAEPKKTATWAPIIDQVTVEAGFEAALGAALGEDLNAAGDDSSPVRWAELPPFVEYAPLPGGVRALSEVVNAPSRLARRLSQIGIATPEQAQTLHAELKPGQRLVTTQGDLWRWDGYVASGGQPSAAATRLRQRNRLKDLREQLSESRAALDEAEAHVAETKQAVGEAQAREQAARGFVRSTEDARNRTARELADLRQKVAALQSRLNSLEDSRAQLQAEVDEAITQIETVQARLVELGDGADLRAEAESKASGLSQLRQNLMEARAVYDGLARQADERNRRIEALSRDSSGWQSRRDEAARQEEALQGRLAAAAAEIQDLASRPAQIEENRRALMDQLELAEAERRERADALAVGENRLAAADKALKEAEHLLAEAREERVRREGTVTTIEHDMAMLDANIRERIQCEPGEVRAQTRFAEDGEEIPPLEKAEKSLQRLVSERENLGAINLLAEQESAELQEKITGLTAERDDLVAAIARLREGIATLNKEGRERLLKSFHEVDGHFKNLFTKLFGGGRAHLELTEAEDPLEAGLEIMASPPGKRLGNLGLMSGGEQALTALALLFAVFMTNPAPICVLDEVDAPLDDANVDRFCSLVAEIIRQTETRVLCVTHHRMTMARMDRLFGVTMAERGVSRLVSVDLKAAEEMRDVA